MTEFITLFSSKKESLNLDVSKEDQEAYFASPKVSFGPFIFSEDLIS